MLDRIRRWFAGTHRFALSRASFSLRLNASWNEYTSRSVAAVAVLPNADVRVIVAGWSLREAFRHLNLDVAGDQKHADVGSPLNEVLLHAIPATAALNRIPAVGAGSGRCCTGGYQHMLHLH